jgi:hypothetical protein
MAADMNSPHGPGSDLSESEKRAALDFALQSESLCRSDRLKSLLRFICEAEFAGRQEQLTEYEIAVSALGRRKDFSSLEDSTVRSRAFELRQKLERLYSVEAPEYPVHILIPKGSYRSRFLRHQVPDAESPLVSTPTISPPAPDELQKRLRWILPTVSFACGVLLTISVWLGTRYLPMTPAHLVASNPWSPELRQFWTPFLSNSRPAILVFESRLFVQVGPIVVRDPEVESLQNIGSSPIMQVKHLLNVPDVFEVRRYSDYSMVNASFSIGQLFGAAKIPIRAERSDELSNADVAGCNLIEIGKPGAYDNLKHLSPKGVNFIYEPYRDSQIQGIRNLQPQPGELPLYEGKGGSVASGGTVQRYGLITLTPGPFKGQHILNLVSGESELFRPLALYITDPGYVRDLVSHLREPSGKLPEAFEVLVSIQMRGYQPQRIDYVAHRVLPANP